MLTFTRSAGDHRVVVMANFADSAVPTPPLPDGPWTLLVSSVADNNPQLLQPMEAKVFGQTGRVPA